MGLWGARQEGKASLAGGSWWGWGREGAGGRGRSERASECQVPLLPGDWPLGAGRVGDKKEANDDPEAHIMASIPPQVARESPAHHRHRIQI